MYKFILLLMIPCLFISCKEEKNNSTLLSMLEGNWIDEKTESTHISIEKEAEAHWLLSEEERFLITAKDDRHMVRMENDELPLNYDKEKKVLSFKGVNYVAEGVNLNKQFVGTWHNTNEETVLVIEEVEGALVWNISTGDEPPIKHLAEKTENGFTFMFNGEEVFFEKNNNCIEDSKGRAYCKAKT